jgi:hypothetical protein
VRFAAFLQGQGAPLRQEPVINQYGVAPAAESQFCEDIEGTASVTKRTTSAEGSSTPVVDPCPSMLRLFVAVPSLCNSTQPHETRAKNEQRGWFGDRGVFVTRDVVGHTETGNEAGLPEVGV